MPKDRQKLILAAAAAAVVLFIYLRSNGSASPSTAAQDPTATGSLGSSVTTEDLAAGQQTISDQLSTIADTLAAGIPTTVSTTPTATAPAPVVNVTVTSPPEPTPAAPSASPIVTTTPAPAPPPQLTPSVTAPQTIHTPATSTVDHPVGRSAAVVNLPIAE